MSKSTATLLAITVLGLLAWAGPSAAETVVVTLDAGTIPENVQCGETWQEAGVTLSLVETTADDCDGGGSCLFGRDPLGVWLFPARLHLDLTGLVGTFLSGAIVDSDVNTLVGEPETLTLVAGSPVDVLAVSSCEGMCIEVREDGLGAAPSGGRRGISVRSGRSGSDSRRCPQTLRFGSFQHPSEES